jgi:hypothetical protein
MVSTYSNAAYVLNLPTMGMTAMGRTVPFLVRMPPTAWVVFCRASPSIGPSQLRHELPLITLPVVQIF